jgi:hypothetical protein
MSSIIYASNMSNPSNISKESIPSVTPNISENNLESPQAPVSPDEPRTVFAFKDKRHHKLCVITQPSDDTLIVTHELDGPIVTIQKVKAYDVLKPRNEHGNPAVDTDTVWLFAYVNPNGETKRPVLLEGWSHTTQYKPTSLLQFAMDFADPYPHIALQVMRCLQADAR